MVRKRKTKFKTPTKKVTFKKKVMATDKQLAFLSKHGLKFQHDSISLMKASEYIKKIKADIEKQGKSVSLETLTKTLNQNLPKSEQWFLDQLKLRNLDLKLKQNIIVAQYIADFLNEKLKIIIEIDGSIHDKNEIVTKDIYKDQTLTELGYKVIRIIHNDIKSLDEGISTYLKLIYQKPTEIKKRPQVSRVWVKGKCGKCKQKEVNLNKFFYKEKPFYYCNSCFGAYAKTQKE